MDIRQSIQIQIARIPENFRLAALAVVHLYAEIHHLSRPAKSQQWHPLLGYPIPENFRLAALAVVHLYAEIHHLSRPAKSQQWHPLLGYP